MADTVTGRRDPNSVNWTEGPNQAGAHQCGSWLREHPEYRCNHTRQERQVTARK
jgi:hypothetical protein